ncbi:hypothetical protein ABTL04_20745, partial [Acinetobacter baumannii]
MRILSIHCEERLIRFEELANDPTYGVERAIKGLESWKFTQKYRLTDIDNKQIDSYIKRYKN